MLRASEGRCVARWMAVGVERDVSQVLAADRKVGRRGETLYPALGAMRPITRGRGRFRGRSEGVERYADDVQPPGEAAEREVADRLARGADRGEVAVEPVSGGASDSATEGSRSRSVWRTTSACVGLLADRLAQEPDAIADVAGLVVMDLRVAVDEPRQQPLADQVVGRELEGRQAERALEDRGGRA